MEIKQPGITLSIYTNQINIINFIKLVNVTSLPLCELVILKENCLTKSPTKLSKMFHLA